MTIMDTTDFTQPVTSVTERSSLQISSEKTKDDLICPEDNKPVVEDLRFVGRCPDGNKVFVESNVVIPEGRWIVARVGSLLERFLNELELIERVSNDSISK